MTRLEEILKSFNKSIKLDPYIPLFYTNRGYAYAELGRYDDEIKDYMNAINIDDEFSFAWYNMACYYATPKLIENMPEDDQKAIDCLKKAIAIDKSWKTDAIEDNDFDLIKKNPEFIKLVG